MKKFIKEASLSCLLILSGCNTDDLETSYQDKVVVEAYLYVNHPVKISISRLTAYDPDSEISGDDINNLNVTINNEVTLIPQGEGVYKGPDSYLIEEGRDYTLSFVFNEKEVTATTHALHKPIDYWQSVTSIEATSFSGPPAGGGIPSFPDPIELTWSNPENDYYLVVVENIESEPEAINDFGDEEPPSTTFRNEPYQTSSTEINSMQFEYYGTHRLVLFHITPEYASLYKDSGTTSQNITTPPTNVTNGLGIYTALNSDTLFIEVTH